MSALAEAFRAKRRLLLGDQQWRDVPLADREDALAQAASELLRHEFASVLHASRTLELRYHSRVRDGLRRGRGRSGDAVFHSIPLEVRDDFTNASRHGVTYLSPERVVLSRDLLTRLMTVLSETERTGLRGKPVSIDGMRKRRYRARAKLKAAA